MSPLLRRYAELLAADADRLGLTALRDVERIEHELIADSLTASDLLTENARVLDIGSGGGCPGLPLAIVRPELSFTLLEANGRKAGFLSATVEALSLSNVAVIKERSEFLARQASHREAYGTVVAKAVAPLPTLVELALPFLRLDGFLIAFKGPSVDEELAKASNALRRVGGAHVRNRAYELLDRSYVHCVICKKKPTSHEYPRRPGIPAHSPL